MLWIIKVARYKRCSMLAMVHAACNRTTYVRSRVAKEQLIPAVCRTDGGAQRAYRAGDADGPVRRSCDPAALSATTMPIQSRRPARRPSWSLRAAAGCRPKAADPPERSCTLSSAGCSSSTGSGGRRLPRGIGFCAYGNALCACQWPRSSTSGRSDEPHATDVRW